MQTFIFISFSSFWDLFTWVNVIWPRCSFYQFVLKPLPPAFDLELLIWLVHIKNATSMGISHKWTVLWKNNLTVLVWIYLRRMFILHLIYWLHTPIGRFPTSEALKMFLVFVLMLLADFSQNISWTVLLWFYI